MRGLVHTSDLADDLVGPSAAKTKLRSSSSTSSIIWIVLLNPLQSWLSPPRSNIYEAEDGDWREVQVAAKSTLYTRLISVARLDFAVNVFSQVLTVNGAVVLQRDLSEGAGLVHVVDRWAIEHLWKAGWNIWKAGWNVGISRSGILFPAPFLPLKT